MVQESTTRRAYSLTLTTPTQMVRQGNGMTSLDLYNQQRDLDCGYFDSGSSRLALRQRSLTEGDYSSNSHVTSLLVSPISHRAQSHLNPYFPPAHPNEEHLPRRTHPRPILMTPLALLGMELPQTVHIHRM